ncbi:hypothetical protein [Streptomyces sp900129855]|jgi:hypothetical protein|uniref:Uncharacterized protein n=1 Tax=Streptomyces sp. 900129855 TaxID=3155129 RepID=A0ABV2ZEG4_9ACTN
MDATPFPDDPKQEQREVFRAEDPTGGPLTTDQGVAVDRTDDSLAAGEQRARGPTLVTPPPAEAGGFSLRRVGVATDQPGP